MKKLINRINGRRHGKRARLEPAGHPRQTATFYRPHDPELGLNPPFALLVTGPR